MAADTEPLELAGEFPAASRDGWRALVSAVLARSGFDAGEPGADPETELASRTYDGVTIKALYTAEDAPAVATGAPGSAPFVRGSTVDGPARTGWDVRQRHADPDPARTNAAALADLANGSTSLWLTVGDRGIATSDLGRALDGVHLDRAAVVLDAGGQTRAATLALLSLAEQRGVDPAAIRGSLGADPVGHRARTGAQFDPDLLPSLAEQSKTLSGVQLATVDGSVYHDAGGSDSDELAVATSVGVSYLRALTESGLSVDAAFAALEFRFAVTADQFLSIAKLRAARRVWGRVAELSGASAEARGQRQHAVTSAAMMTRRDPWVNMLRTTIACFAAAIGGADAISVAPFDAAIGLPDDFSRRIARNTSAILHDEASLARVIDAAGGSWYVESLTDQLASLAWEKFTALERAGGALATLDSGAVGELLAASSSARAEDIAHRRAPITGVSEYAFIDETPVTRPAAPAAPAAPADGRLPALRYAAEFEALRDRSDAAPERPKVFLAALGPVAAYGSRVGFASNLFAAAGIETVVGTGDQDELVAALQADATAVACLCSSDQIYAESAEALARALRDVGARWIWLAGTAEMPGVDGSVSAGCDALAVLGRTLDTLGVPS